MRWRRRRRRIFASSWSEAGKIFRLVSFTVERGLHDPPGDVNCGRFCKWRTVNYHGNRVPPWRNFAVPLHTPLISRKNIRGDVQASDPACINRNVRESMALCFILYSYFPGISRVLFWKFNELPIRFYFGVK